MPDDRIVLPNHSNQSSWKTAAWIVAGIILIVVLCFLAIRITHHNKLLPGSRAYGLYLGGMSFDQAKTYLTEQTQDYRDKSTLTINAPGVEATSVPAKEVELSYDVDRSVDELATIGREGQVWQQALDQFQLMTGTYELPPPHMGFNSQKLFAIIAPAYSKLNQVTLNASLKIDAAGAPSIAPEVTGERLALSRSLNDLTSVWSRLEQGGVTIQTNPQLAAVPAGKLQPHLGNLARLTTTPLTLNFEARNWKVPTNEVLSWFSYSQEPGPVPYDQLQNFYALNTDNNNQFSLDSSRIAGYLGSIAKDVNQQAVDAQLTVNGDRAQVFKQSRDGRQIDITTTTERIISAMENPNTAAVSLAVKTQIAEVNDETIDRLGVKELLSEGVSYFPGSSANRMTNVRVGAAKYQGVLLRPGQTFSFGEILGEVGPAQGYKEGHVILEGRQENQYGGGLCQVSSTAFRAALLAGLQITERYNHAFAIDYYTRPFGVPGVDATIYYPQVDFKFKNDTPNYILIQTEMVGTTLKFRFYGTKEKEGVIRGPFFVSGSSNANAPSKTVFYRDIVKNGAVVKTDTFYTSYRSALDFPSVD